MSEKLKIGIWIDKFGPLDKKLKIRNLIELNYPKNQHFANDLRIGRNQCHWIHTVELLCDFKFHSNRIYYVIVRVRNGQQICRIDLIQFKLIFGINRAND